MRRGGDTASRLQCSRSRTFRHHRLGGEGMAGWRWWKEVRVDQISRHPIDPLHMTSKIREVMVLLKYLYIPGTCLAF